MAAIKDAGVKQIDHLIITHYHNDHIGGLSELATHILNSASSNCGGAE
jgi:competence protein ComEC